MRLQGKKILIFVAEGFEDLELFYPKYRLIEEGAEVHIAGCKENETYHSKHGYPCKSDMDFEKVQVPTFDALIIPGGQAPDKLRALPDVIEITQQFHQEGKLIACICHGGSVLVSAGILQGVRCTSFHSIKDDIINAGATWIDNSVVSDKNIISSRCPDDLPHFTSAIIAHLLGKGIDHETQALPN